MQSIIKLENITVIKEKKIILDCINWEIKQNENWAVLGPNGAGKSFLLRLLSTQYHPSQGEIRLFNQKMGEVNVWDLRKKIGIVSDFLQARYQHNSLVKEVVYSGFFSSIGLYQRVDQAQQEQAKKIMQLLGIDSFQNRAFGRLSHGEQRRVLIARAMVLKPKLLILDEPCTGLDIPSREEFLYYLQELIQNNINIVFVTHHIEEIIPQISQVLLIKNGALFLKGKKEQVLRKEILNQLFDYKFKITTKNQRYWTSIV